MQPTRITSLQLVDQSFGCRPEIEVQLATLLTYLKASSGTDLDVRWICRHKHKGEAYHRTRLMLHGFNMLNYYFKRVRSIEILSYRSVTEYLSAVIGAVGPLPRLCSLALRNHATRIDNFRDDDFSGFYDLPVIATASNQWPPVTTSLHHLKLDDGNIALKEWALPSELEHVDIRFGTFDAPVLQRRHLTVYLASLYKLRTLSITTSTQYH